MCVCERVSEREKGREKKKEKKTEIDRAIVFFLKRYFKLIKSYTQSLAQMFQIVRTVLVACCACNIRRRLVAQRDLGQQMQSAREGVPVDYQTHNLHKEEEENKYVHASEKFS